jgi:hypothetical protein
LTRPVFGGLVAILGLLVATGQDLRLEAMLTDAIPPWMIDLATRF